MLAIGTVAVAVAGHDPTAFGSQPPSSLHEEAYGRTETVEPNLEAVFERYRPLDEVPASVQALPADGILPGSLARLRESGVWEPYRSYFVDVAALVGLQSMLIAGLVIQRAKRRRTELALRQSERDLRRSYEENHDLAGRLINAQEAERARIARDLHDDLSQQLAGLAIVLSGLKRTIVRPDSQPDVERTVTNLRDRTTALAESIRNLSHQLHPSVLQHAGLVVALTRHCADVEQHHHLPVAFNARGDFESLDPELALCLFRVTQEALNNAVRHARASVALVDVIRNETGIELSVVDDGIGFVPGERTRAGLGLRSIDERVRFARGYVTVDSQPGRGTSLTVRIPVAAAQTALA
jgi:two-component system sensor histidine kinase UhpB